MSEILLSAKQREIVNAGEGAILVLAGAGSGKTRVLTERVRALVTNKPGKFKVLALTFTNKAAEEMQNRLKGIPGIQNRTFIGTIHKFCLELLRSQGTSIGLTEMPHIFERDSDRFEVVIQVFNSIPQFKTYIDEISDDAKRKKYLFDILSYISQKKKNLYGIINSNSNQSDELDRIFREYNSVLASQNAIDFDDVICLAYRLFAERPKIAELYRNMYKYICIDEAQDLNFAQYELIKILCGSENRNVLMVGDPNQAIYGFNGSDKIYMTEKFPADFQANKILLIENYRSSKKVLEIANKLIPNSSDDRIAAIKGEGEIVACVNEEEEANWVVNKILSLLKQKKHPDIESEINEDCIAVLARNKYVFKSVAEKLDENDIPYVFKKTNDLSEYESDLMKALDLGTRILVNPLDELHFYQLKKILNANILNIKTNTGLEKLQSFSLPEIEEDKRNDLKTLFSAWELVASNVNSFPKALNLIDGYVNTNRFYESNLNLRSLILQDIEYSKQLWRQYSLDSNSEAKSMSSFRNQIALGIPTNTGSNSPRITLGTVHSVKGLEFEIVFLIGMNEGTFPDYRAVKNQDALNEEKNNAFVAITRSRRLLYITYPKAKFMPWDKTNPIFQKPSRFISSLI